MAVLTMMITKQETDQEIIFYLTYDLLENIMFYNEFLVLYMIVPCY